MTWVRGGSSPEVWLSAVEYSNDGVTCTNLSAGLLVLAGWRLVWVSLPPGATIRAPGYTVVGDGNGSGWFVESLLPTIAILTHDADFRVMANQFGFNIRGVGSQVVLVEGSSNLVQ